MESEQVQLLLGFSAGNGPRTYQLKSEIAHCKQNGGEPVAQYFGRLKKLWDELSQLDPADCSTKLGAEIERRREEERLYQFLMGLDHDYFVAVGSTVLNYQPLPSVDRTYSIVIREEEDRVVKSNRVVSHAAVARNSTRTKTRKISLSPIHVEFPEDILVEILVRLPPKPLFRFGCVSKQWKSIVWNPEFARNYNLKLGRSSSGMLFPYLYQIPHRPDMGFSGWSSKELYVPHPHHHHHPRHRLMFYFRTALRHYDRRILASSNGLLLSQIRTLDHYYQFGAHHEITLCVSNPLTKQHATLPRLCLPRRYERYPVIRPWTCGFATRAATDISGSYNVSYKVVVVVPPAESALDPANHSSIQIFSSDVGSWKCVPGPISSIPPALLRNGYKAQDFCYKGILHWLDREGGTRTIVTYDAYKSPTRFGHIRMPHDASGGQIIPTSLMSLIHLGPGHEEEEHLLRCCEIERCRGDSSLSLLVWRMTDYGKQLWCLEQRCAIIPDSLKLLKGCRQLIAPPDHQNPAHGVFCYLFVRCSSRRIVAIDLGSGKEEDVKISGNVVPHCRWYCLDLPHCGTLPFVPFVSSPWTSPNHYKRRAYPKTPLGRLPLE